MSCAVLGQGQRGAEVGILGVEGHRQASVLERITPLSIGAIGFLDHGPREVIVGFGVVGLELAGGAVFGDRVGIAAFLLKLEDFGEAHVGIDEVGLKAAGGAILGDRLIQLP